MKLTESQKELISNELDRLFMAQDRRKTFEKIVRIVEEEPEREIDWQNSPKASSGTVNLKPHQEDDTEMTCNYCKGKNLDEHTICSCRSANSLKEKPQRKARSMNTPSSVRDELQQEMERYKNRPSDANKAFTSVLALIDSQRAAGYEEGKAEGVRLMAEAVKEIGYAIHENQIFLLTERWRYTPLRRKEVEEIMGAIINHFEHELETILATQLENDHE